MNMIPVKSSNVAAIGYEDGIIKVDFLNGRSGQYSGTNETLFNEFLNSPSKGKFVHQRLKPFYPYTPLY